MTQTLEQTNLFRPVDTTPPVPAPPGMRAMGFREGSQNWGIWALFCQHYYDGMTHPTLRSSYWVGIGPLLGCSPSNHRARICKIKNDVLRRPEIVERFGRWTIQQRGDGGDSSYRLVCERPPV